MPWNLFHSGRINDRQKSITSEINVLLAFIPPVIDFDCRLFHGGINAESFIALVIDIPVVGYIV